MKTINNNRIVEFDIARGVAVFLMIIQHSWLLIFVHFVHNQYLDLFFFTLGTVLVAPLFLFLLGVNSIKSRRNLFIRGLWLVLLGYLLSALRFYIPITLGSYFGIISNPENIIYHFEPIYYLLQIDIFQVAGLSLIGIAILKKWHINKDYYLVLAFIISFISPLLWQLNVSNIFLDPFIGKHLYVVFPFFPWFIYSLVGFYFGSLFLESKDKVSFYKKTVSKIFLIFISGLSLFIMEFIFSGFSYARHGFGASLLFISLIIYWLAFIKDNHHRLSIKNINILTFISKNVSVIYFISWLFIAWLGVYLSID